jgi:hypothetical protein
VAPDFGLSLYSGFSALSAAMNLNFHFLFLVKEIRFFILPTPLTDFQIDRPIARIV